MSVECKTCARPIVGQGLEALGNKYHADCFTCQGCNKVLTGSFVDRAGRPYHRECVPGGPPKKLGPCAGCAGALEGGRSLSALGRSWHPHCFKCAGCHKPLEGSFIAPDGSTPYHSQCYVPHHDSGRPPCRACGKALNGHAIELEQGKTYMHEDCFRCSGCDTRFGKGELYVQHGERFFHDKCSPHAVKCHACARLILEDHLKVNGQHYHKACWRCATCGRDADENMVVLGGKPYHIGTCTTGVAGADDDE